MTLPNPPEILKAGEDFAPQSFDLQVDPKRGQVNTFTRRYKITTTGGPGANVVAANWPGLPRLRDPHPNDPLARVKSVHGASQSEDGTIFGIDVQYADDVPSEEEQNEQEPDNPLDAPPDVEWTFQEFSKPLDKDCDGLAVANSSGEIYDPLPEVDDARLVLSYTRNLASYPVMTAVRYQNKVNSDTFLGFAAGYVKCKPIPATRQYKDTKDSGRIFYYRVKFEFHFRDPDLEETWDLRLLDRGFRAWAEDPDGVERMQLITDNQERPLSTPANLNGEGSVADRNADPVFLPFKAYHRRPFSTVFDISDIA